MSLRKTLTIAAITASAALSLTACGPEKDDAAGNSTPSASNSASAPADSTAGGGDQPSSTPSASSSSSADAACGLKPGHKVRRIDSIYGADAKMSAHFTKCDPNAPTGSTAGQWKVTKDQQEGYLLADTVKAKLMRKNGSLTPASKEEVIQMIMACTKDPNVENKYGLCGQNKYDIVVDDKGVITEMTELFDV